ncbi:sigma-54-dependent Fis family transcriptional regulator [Thermosulfuriphilus ammonigenes]|uniref:Sigma-54-dependent Fis family transcriptional regulator n=2 Tax=Thermosulfuriphilus ammonigenes TaxID=1936021 RepID=A0A6G7PUP0_9BACT|nr:sigma-54-dependent Fis family transcriptional regulator [Thermosulfuriphilus ammonigenes]
MMAHLLIVDDDRSLRQFLDILFSKDGYQVFTAETGKEALKLMEKQPVDVVLADIRMPEMDGLSLLKEIKGRWPQIPVIMITAFASMDTAVSAMREGAFDYVTKPFNLSELRETVARALKKAEKSREGEPKGEQIVQFEGMVAKSAAMRKIFSLLPKVAQAPSNVLITGESGTGKELIARAIHRLSPRKDRPFVVVNCGGIPANLLESELFGYSRGAFTGATREKKGLFAVAHGGTIFLDEIGELPPELQVKLLRVVQQKSFIPLGETQEIEVDVRIISATNRDLEKEVLAGNFREDLYYRLNVISIHVPPLRERREDIPVLVQYFLDKYARQMGKKVEGISAYALKALEEYDFPGNIRELENIIERSVALETGSLILPESLVLSRSKRQEEGDNGQKDFRITLPEKGLDLEELLAKIEMDLLKQALERTGGVKTEAAKLLGLNFRSFRYRLAKYNL